ncbi:MAG: hemerythrin domain-containing protein [Elusimicrobia bacterium]|nr:hemerythrin domain-containing protein [Elusimicrobiota bacterium]
MKNSDEQSSPVIPFALGLAAGAAVGALIASAAFADVRRRLKNWIGEHLKMKLLAEMKRQNLTDEILADHRAILGDLGRLEGLLAASPGGAELSSAEVQRLLGSLRKRLAAHFELEESGGKLEEVTEFRPEFNRQVAALYEEHRELLRRADGLCELAETPASQEASGARALQRAFLEFAADLRLHERKENDIILEAYLTDVGTAG